MTAALRNLEAQSFLRLPIAKLYGCEALYGQPCTGKAKRA